MAGKKITELTQANAVADTDLFIVETNEGTKAVPYSLMKPSSGSEIVDCAASHNNIYRGKDLTNVYTIDEICERISNGTFEDLYVGDYFDVTISTTELDNERVRCVFAGFDIRFELIGAYTHHAVIVPNNCFYNLHAPMNTTQTTGVSENSNNQSDLDAYVGSDMHNIILPMYATAIENVIGGSHLFSITNRLSKNINNDIPSKITGETGLPTSWKRDTHKLELLSESQVFGSQLITSYYDTGFNESQLPLFKLNPSSIKCVMGEDVHSLMYGWWLKNVASNECFSIVSISDIINNNSFSVGINCGYSYANSYNIGVRPFFCIG